MNLQGYRGDMLVTVMEMERVAPEWDALAARSATPLLKADWFLACAEALCQESNLRVVVVRKQGKVCAIAPLVLAMHSGVEWLEILGASALYEPTGLIYDDRDSLRYLLRAIVDSGNPAVFHRMLLDSPVGEELRDVSWLRGSVVQRRTASAAFVEIEGAWEECYGSLSSKTRYEFRRLRKEMEQTGPVRVRIERPLSRPHLLAMLQELLRVEAAGWKGRTGTALVTNDGVRRFINRYCERVCDRGTLRFAFLDVQGRPIAASLSVQDLERFWGLKIGYDEAWARCAPGIQLTMETLKYAFESGLKGYEFLGSEESWQRRWPLRRRAYVSVVLYPHSLRGVRALAGDLVRFVKKRRQQRTAAMNPE